jgi:hypothetical protein
MAVNEIAEKAFERAWRVYRLLNARVDETSERRPALKAFIRKCCAHGATDTEAIVVLALIHLKQLDELAAHGRIGTTRLQSGRNGTKGPASG